MSIPRNVRWAGFGAIALAALSAGVLLCQPGLEVIVYNNTNAPFGRVTVTVGNEARQRTSLEPRESIAFPFEALDRAADVHFSVASDPPVLWNAPSLATPNVRSITLRVDEFGGVSHTVENRWNFGN